MTLPATTLTVLLSCLLPILSAQELHVALSGDDAAAGNASAPWATIGRATSAAQAGDTIVIHGGTYVHSSRILFARSGTAGNPITLTARSGDTVLISGSGTNVLNLQFRSHITVRDLAFTSTSTAVGASMVYMENTDHCEFHDCRFSGMPAEYGRENTAVIRCMATGGNGFSTGCVFRNNLFADNASPALRLYDTDGWLIEHNEFRDCQQAVGGKDQPFNMVVRRNLVHGGDLAFYFAGQGGASNVEISENIVVGSRQAFQFGGLGTSGAMRDDIRLHNNTLVDCYTFLNGWDDGFNRRIRFTDNILHATAPANIHGGSDVAGRLLNLNKYGSVPVDMVNYEMDRNCLSLPTADTSWWFINATNSSRSLSHWRTLQPTLETRSINAAPLFVDATVGDYHLQDASPGRGAGVAGLDIGAYPRGDDGTIIGRIPRTTHARPLAFTPTILLDAEDGTVGATHQGAGSSRWSDAAGRTTVSDGRAFDGDLSFNCHADAGTLANEGQFGSWGGRKALPTALLRGDTLQVQFSLFLPASFDWMADPWLKLARIHIATSTGGNVGYQDMYIHQDGNLAYHSEVVGTVTRIPGHVIATGVWETFEMAVTLDSIAAADGGQGRVRIWRHAAGAGMQLIYENGSQKTLNAATDRCDAFLLFTYWNSRSDRGPVYPLQAQDCWVDRVVIEPDQARLVERDAGGLPIIGGVAVNRSPVAQASSLGTRVGTALAISLAASDADGDDLTFAITAPPRHGSLSGSDQAWIYMPEPGFIGTDSFSFGADDGRASSTATVTIRVDGSGSSDNTSAAGSSSGGCGLGALGVLMALLAFRLRGSRSAQRTLT